jgi:hypothetical protein
MEACRNVSVFVQCCTRVLHWYVRILFCIHCTGYVGQDNVSFFRCCCGLYFGCGLIWRSDLLKLWMNLKLQWLALTGLDCIIVRVCTTNFVPTPSELTFVSAQTWKPRSHYTHPNPPYFDPPVSSDSVPECAVLTLYSSRVLWRSMLHVYIDYFAPLYIVHAY